jgi:hypothetical protein
VRALPAAGPPSTVAVPAYFHPALAPGDWATLARPGRPVRAAVLNVANGAGAAPEPALAAVAHRAAAAGVPVLGYVDTDYGARPAAEIAAEVRRYRSWYATSGFFLDQVSPSAGLLPWYQRVVADAREQGPATVVLNHGVYPDAGYADIADALVTFEGPWRAYAVATAPEWALRRPAETFWHLVYDTPAALLGPALRRAARCNAGTVYVTDRGGRNPWDGLPSYFDRLVGAVSPAVARRRVVRQRRPRSVTHAPVGAYSA